MWMQRMERKRNFWIRIKMNEFDKPILINHYPTDCNEIKHIKGSLYESYVSVPIESVFHQYEFEMIMEHAINRARTANFFVKSIYCKYRILPSDLTVYALELVKLKNPIFHQSVNIVNGAIQARSEK